MHRSIFDCYVSRQEEAVPKKHEAGTLEIKHEDLDRQRQLSKLVEMGGTQCVMSDLKTEKRVTHFA